MATVTKRGNGFQITASLGYDAQYRQVRKTTTYRPPAGTSPARAMKLAQAAAVEFENRVKGLQSLNENMRLRELLDWYSEGPGAHRVTENSMAEYQRLFELYLLPALGNCKLKELTPARLDVHWQQLHSGGAQRSNLQLREGSPLWGWCEGKRMKVAAAAGVYIATLRTVLEGKPCTPETAAKIAAAFGVKVAELFEPTLGKQGLSASSVHRVFTALSSVYGSAVKAGIVKENPLARCTLPRVDSTAPKAFMDEEHAKRFVALLDAQPQSSVRMCLLTALLCGMRSGELLALHWRDVDTQHGVIYVRYTLHYANGQYALAPPKTTSSERAIKVIPQLVAALVDYRRWQEEQAAALGQRWQDNGLVFPNQTGGFMNHSVLNARFRHIIAGQGFPAGLHFHSLRHAHASLLIHNGVHATAVSKQLGHSSTTVTLQVYTHAFSSATAQAAQALEMALV